MKIKSKVQYNIKKKKNDKNRLINNLPFNIKNKI